MTQFFNGRVLIAPQVEVAVDDSAIGPQAVTGDSLNVGILGYSTLGAPDVPVLLSSAAEAIKAFGKGTLVDGILSAMNPSGAGVGAVSVYGVRVNQGTQSTGNLLDTNANSVIALTTQDYGVATRSDSVKLAAATGGASNVPANALKVTVSDGINTPASADNLGYNVLALTYSPAGGAVRVDKWHGTVHTGGYTAPQTSIQVDASSGFDTHQIVVGQQVVIADSGGTNPVTVTVLTSDGAGNITISPADTHNRLATATVIATGNSLLLTKGSGQLDSDTAGYLLTNYNTLADLATAARATGVASHWSVVVPTSLNPVPGSRAVIGAAGSPLMLDVIPSNTTVNASPAIVVTGVAQAVTDWLNGSLDTVFTAVRNTSLGTVPIAQTAVATGGDDDGDGGSLLANTMAVTSDDWQDALNALASVDVSLFTLMTSDSSLHGMGDTHAHTVSTIGKLERIQVAGGPLGDARVDALGAASAIDSYRTGLVYPGIQDFDSNGNLVTLEPFYAAAKVAGLAAALGNNGGSITNKTLNIQGLEVRSSGAGGPYTQDDYDALCLGGVIGIQRRPNGGFRIVQGVTTWLQDFKFSKRELSVRLEIDAISRAVREGVDPLIGNLVGPSLLSAAKSIVQGILDKFAAKGTIVGDSTSPAYKGLTLSIPPGRGDTLLISFECSPGIPANYVLITNHITPFNG